MKSNRTDKPSTFLTRVREFKKQLPFLITKAQSYLYDYGLLATTKKIFTFHYTTPHEISIINDSDILTPSQFAKADKSSVVEKGIWIFPVCAYEHTLSGNERALFEQVKDDPQITKVILTRSKAIELSGAHVHILALQSLKGQEFLLKSSIIFIKHTPRVNVLYPLDPAKHKFINLWHGIPLKRVGIASLDLHTQYQEIKQEHSKLYKSIASSAIDKMAMASAFYPLTYNDIWLTGLPRHDFILRSEKNLPLDFQQESSRLDKALSHKKLILFAPTFRNDPNDSYTFSQQEKEQLFNTLEEHNALLGIREHMAEKKHTYLQQLQHESVIDLNADNYPNIELLYRKADLLITDYSSCFIDFMLTGKPMISFAYDYTRYTKEERGLFYDLEFAFPGKICQNSETLILEIKTLLSNPYLPNDIYRFKQKIFFEYMDDNNADRVCQNTLKIDK